MSPEGVPSGPLLVDTDVLSWMALREGRAEEFARLIVGHEAFVSFVTLAEVRTLLAMNVLTPDSHKALTAALGGYTVLPTRVDHIVAEWVKLRAATISSGSADDRERRQNDTWIAACALSVEPPLPIVTGNLRDFVPLADATSSLRIIHPDL